MNINKFQIIDALGNVYGDTRQMLPDGTTGYTVLGRAIDGLTYAPLFPLQHPELFPFSIVHSKEDGTQATVMQVVIPAETAPSEPATDAPA